MQCRQRHAVERFARGKLGDLCQDLATALRLLSQQFHVIGIRRIRFERAFNFAHDDRDCGKGRAEFVRCGGRETVELRQMLLACQNQLGCRQRIGKLARLFRDLPRVDADIADREQDREPHPDHIDFRQLKRILGIPRQIVMQEHQYGGAEHCERADQQRHARRQRSRRNQHRAQQQEGETDFPGRR